MNIPDNSPAPTMSLSERGTGPSALLRGFVDTPSRPKGTVVEGADRSLAAVVGAALVATLALAAGLAGLLLASPVLTYAGVAVLGIPIAALIGWTLARFFLPGRSMWLAVGLAVLACELGNVEIWIGVAAWGIVTGAPSDTMIAGISLVFGLVFSLMALPLTIPTILLAMAVFRRLRVYDSRELRVRLGLLLLADLAGIVIVLFVVFTRAVSVAPVWGP